MRGQSRSASAPGPRTGERRRGFRVHPLIIACGVAGLAVAAIGGWLALDEPSPAPGTSRPAVELLLEPAAQLPPEPEAETGAQALAAFEDTSPPASEPVTPEQQLEPIAELRSTDSEPAAVEPIPAEDAAEPVEVASGAPAPPATAAEPMDVPPSVEAGTPPPPALENSASAERVAPEGKTPDAAQPAAPDAVLLEEGPYGPLPAVSADGRAPWLAYARPFDAADPRPKIAILITGLGLSEAATRAAIELPGAITLSFAPYAADLKRWSEQARAAGHELFLDLPMEPASYPTDDPGPYALLTSLTPPENLARLDWLLSRFSGYVGVVDVMATKFARADGALRPVLESLKLRGLMVLDSRAVEESAIGPLASGLGMPNASAHLFLDGLAAREAIDEALAELEKRALKTGFAIGIGRPYPVTLQRLGEWTRTLDERGLMLAPVSGAARRKA